jgi:hypothetical protein
MAATRSFPGGLRSPRAGPGRRGPDEQVENLVVGDTVNLAPWRQGAAPPAGSTVVGDRCQRRAYSALRPHKVDCRGTAAAAGQGPDWTTPLAVFMVRPGSADAVLCVS